VLPAPRAGERRVKPTSRRWWWRRGGKKGGGSLFVSSVARKRLPALSHGQPVIGPRWEGVGAGAAPPPLPLRRWSGQTVESARGADAVEAEPGGHTKEKGDGVVGGRRWMHFSFKMSPPVFDWRQRSSSSIPVAGRGHGRLSASGLSHVCNFD